MEPAARAIAVPGAAEPRARIPVTVLAGFLGSGKTTLLNRILAGDHGLRITVFVNDFGSIAIDRRLIVSRDATTIALDNGCVCCSVSNDLVSQLTGVLEGPACPEHVLIETSGVSDPGRLLVALRDPHLRSLSRIDGVITVVDVASVDAIPPAQHELARRQLASADVIVFNKVDLVTTKELNALRGRLSYPAARVVETSFGDVPLEVALGVNSRSDKPVSGGAGLRRTMPATDHSESFATWSWVCDQPLSYGPVRRVLASLPPDVYRAKGFLYLAEACEQRVVAHVVGTRVDVRPLGTWDGVQPRSELVFISLRHGIDVSSLRERLAETVAGATEPDGHRQASTASAAA